MNCPNCGDEMDATPSTSEYPNVNTFTCPLCGHVEPCGYSYSIPEEEK